MKKMSIRGINMDIGIIGGADGPTAIYISSSSGSLYAIGAAAVFIGGIIAYLAIRKKRKATRTRK